MNHRNIAKLVKVLDRARAAPEKFDMSRIGGSSAKSEQEFYAGFGRARVDNLIALAPEFHEDGGRALAKARPALDTQHGSLDRYHAVAFWLDIPIALSWHLCGAFRLERGAASRFYEVELSLVTPDDVIGKLERISKAEVGSYRYNTLIV